MRPGRCIEAGGTDRPDGDGGFVLVAVLWIVLLIAGSAALLAKVASVNARATTAFVRSATAEAAADGAIRLIGYRLAYQGQGTGHAALRTDGSWSECRLFSDLTVRVSVQDAGGLLDLNQAPAGLLRSVLVPLLGPDRAGRALLAIAERRKAALSDADRPKPGGGGPASGIPADSGFGSPDELLGPLDLDSRKADAAARLLTVYSRSDGVDPTVAPAALLLLLGIGGSGEQAGGASVALPASMLRPSRRRVFSIMAEAGRTGTGRSIRRAVLELARSSDQPFVVREWGSAGDSGIPPADDPPGPGGDEAPCFAANAAAQPE